MKRRLAKQRLKVIQSMADSEDGGQATAVLSDWQN